MINLIYGPNGCGKTTKLEELHKEHKNSIYIKSCDFGVDNIHKFIPNTNLDEFKKFILEAVRLINPYILDIIIQNSSLFFILNNESPPIPFANMGSGIDRIVLIFAALYSCKEGEYILIDFIDRSLHLEIQGKLLCIIDHIITNRITLYAVIYSPNIITGYSGFNLISMGEDQ